MHPIIDKNSFLENKVPNIIIKAIWSSTEQQLMLLADREIKFGSITVKFAEEFYISKESAQLYFSVFAVNKKTEKPELIARYNTQNQKLEMLLNNLPEFKYIDFSQPNSLSATQIKSLIKLLKKNDKQKVTLSTKPTLLQLGKESYNIQTKKPLKIMCAKISAKTAPTTALLKVMYDGKITQAYKVSKQKKVPLNIIYVDLANLGEDANKERFLTAIEKRYDKASLINDKTKIIPSSLGIYDDNCLLVTTPYDIIPVINSKGQLRYKTIQHEAFGDGACAKVKGNDISINPENKKGEIEVKTKRKVWKLSKKSDDAKWEKTIKDSITTDYTFSRFFPSTYKTKYLLQLPGGCLATDQQRFDMTLEDYLNKVLFSEDIDDTKRFELQITLIRSFLKALAKAHVIIVHRDLKLENVFVTIKDGQPKVKVGDFGYSVTVEDKNDGKYPGTPNYAAPEIFTQKVNEVTEPQDIYSAGVIIATILGAENPDEYFADFELDPTFLEAKKVYFNNNKNIIEKNIPQEFNVFPLLNAMGNLDWTKRPTAQEALDKFKSLCNLNGSCDNVSSQTNRAIMLSP